MTHTDTLTAHDTYREDVIGFLKQLTMEVSDRSTGSVGHHAATDFFQSHLKAIGWATETQSFDVIDWCGGTATLISDRGAAFQVFPTS